VDSRIVLASSQRAAATLCASRASPRAPRSWVCRSWEGPTRTVRRPLGGAGSGAATDGGGTPSLAPPARSDFTDAHTDLRQPPEGTKSTRHATQPETQKGPVGREHRDREPDLIDRWSWQDHTGGMTHDPRPAPPDPGDRQSITPVEPHVGPGLPSPVPTDPRTQSARELARWENEGGRV
jgi:hypothetical protein